MTMRTPESFLDEWGDKTVSTDTTLALVLAVQRDAIKAAAAMCRSGIAADTGPNERREVTAYCDGRMDCADAIESLMPKDQP